MLQFNQTTSIDHWAEGEIHGGNNNNKINKGAVLQTGLSDLNLLIDLRSQNLMSEEVVIYPYRRATLV